jgi:hypothetical protein
MKQTDMIQFDSANIANINEMHIMPDTYPVLRSSEGGSVRLRHLKQESSEGFGQLPCRTLQVSFGARLQSRAKVCAVCGHLWTSAYWAPEQMGMAMIGLGIRCCLSTLNGSDTWQDLDHLVGFTRLSVFMSDLPTDTTLHDHGKNKTCAGSTHS